MLSFFTSSSSSSSMCKAPLSIRICAVSRALSDFFLLISFLLRTFSYPHKRLTTLFHRRSKRGAVNVCLFSTSLTHRSASPHNFPLRISIKKSSRRNRREKRLMIDPQVLLGVVIFFFFFFLSPPCLALFYLSFGIDLYFSISLSLSPLRSTSSSS